MTKIGVTGGRNYKDKLWVFHIMDYVYRNTEDMFLIVGDAAGVDEFCRAWAKYRCIPHEIFEANWTKYGRSAGPLRNKAMRDSGIELLIAFEGGIGTKNMVQLCKEKKIRILTPPNRSMITNPEEPKESSKKNDISIDS